MNIPQHRHCRECGKAIPPDQQYCSEECRRAHTERLRRRRNRIYFYYVLLIIVIILTFVFVV